MLTWNATSGRLCTGQKIPNTITVSDNARIIYRLEEAYESVRATSFDTDTIIDSTTRESISWCYGANQFCDHELRLIKQL